jgi:sister chromatid cohesion protein DCC1
VKGARNDEAVLCTADKTYTLRLAESSNVILLAPNRGMKRPHSNVDDGDTGGTGEGSLEVRASVSAHFEVIRCAPRTGNLLALLSAQPYCGKGDESAAGGASSGGHGPADRRLSLAELEVAVQSSGCELRAALREARALAVDGRWCLLEAQLEQDIVECVLSLCVEHEWPLAALPAARCVERCLEQNIPGFDELSIRHCLRTLSIPADSDWESWSAAIDAEHFALQPEAVCRFRARSLLSECDAWPKDKFLEAWAEALPAGEIPDLSLLNGLAVILQPSVSESDEPIVQHLPVAALPLPPKERFASLFHVKRSWTLDELVPYVKDLLDPGCSATKVVLAHARSVVANDGSVSYVAR